MRRIYPPLVVLMSIIVATFGAPLAQTGTEPAPLDREHKAELIKDLTEALSEIYVFPDVAERMIDLVRKKLERGEYDGLGSLAEFTGRLTEDLQSLSHDKHLHVDPRERRQGGGGGDAEPSDPEERQRRRREAMRFDNYGFHKLERLPGNIGYLDLRGFVDAEIAGATAVAAMNFLANSAALIIDLRQNGGGSPSMIQLISSYFFEEPQHLNTFYIRRSDSYEQFWTQASVQGPKMVDTPIYILTSNRTFSAAEEFAYNLKNLERATIIGETTGGGAHPVEGMVSDLGGGHHASLSIPFGRAINPITKTNWEGTGVQPHVQVPAKQALDAAQLEILRDLAAKEDDAGRKFGFEWARDGLQTRLDPVALTKGTASDFIGQYGPRKITMESGQLIYQRDDGPRYELLAMGKDRFFLADLDYFRVQFGRDASGRVVELIGQYADGRSEGHRRLE